MATPPRKHRLRGGDAPSPVVADKRRRIKLAHFSVGLYVEWGPLCSASPASSSTSSPSPQKKGPENKPGGPKDPATDDKSADPKRPAAEKIIDKPGRTMVGDTPDN